MMTGSCGPDAPEPPPGNPRVEPTLLREYSISEAPPRRSDALAPSYPPMSNGGGSSEVFSPARERIPPRAIAASLKAGKA